MDIRGFSAAALKGLAECVKESGTYTYAEIGMVFAKYVFRNDLFASSCEGRQDNEDAFALVAQMLEFTDKLVKGETIEVAELVSNLALNTLSTACLVLVVVGNTAINLTPACRLAAIVAYAVDTPFKKLFDGDNSVRWDARTKFTKNSLRIIQNVVLLVIPGSSIVIIFFAILAPVVQITANAANSNAFREYKNLSRKPG